MLPKIKEAMKDENLKVFCNGLLTDEETEQGFKDMGLIPRNVIKGIEEQVPKIIEGIPKQTVHWNIYTQAVIDMMHKERAENWHSDLKLMLQRMDILYIEAMGEGQPQSLDL